MGIDIFTRWKEQSQSDEEAQYGAVLSATDGAKGYLREAYHGEPYATRFLVAEAFEQDKGAQIPASVLRERLAFTLELVEERERKIYKSDVKQSYRDFVALCERKEQETEEPVTIIASW